MLMLRLSPAVADKPLLEIGDCHIRLQLKLKKEFVCHRVRDENGQRRHALSVRESPVFSFIRRRTGFGPRGTAIGDVDGEAPKKKRRNNACMELSLGLDLDILVFLPYSVYTGNG